VEVGRGEGAVPVPVPVGAVCSRARFHVYFSLLDIDSTRKRAV
jgi:hypothetical protein